MIKLNVYTVKDTKANACINPFCMRTDFEAQRAFSDSVNDSQKSVPLSQHPEDFVLLAIGEFDQESGAIVAFDVPRSLGVGSDFVKES